MLGLAEWCLLEGVQVTGSDLEHNADAKIALSRLSQLGAQIDFTQSGNYLNQTDLVVRSTAIGPLNSELRMAQKLGKKVLSRGELLAEMSRHRFSIGISGSHGKSTTTALMGHGFRTLWPAHVYLGATSINFGSSFHWGNPSRLIAEVDESDGTFLNFQSDISVLTGLSNDHESFYGSKERLFDAFEKFLSKSTALLRPVICGSDPETKEFLTDRKIREKINVVTYGRESECDVSFTNLRIENSTSIFEVVLRNPPKGSYPGGSIKQEVRLPLLGEHNIFNCLAAFTVAQELELSIENLSQKIRSFRGVARRMEIISSNEVLDIFSDYAHNPQKIGALLKTLTETYGLENVICFFEPHRYTRLKSMWQGFIDVLTICREIYILPFYAAGEACDPQVNREEIQKALKKSQIREGIFEIAEATTHCFSDILRNVTHKNKTSRRKAVVFVGAGKSHEYAKLFAAELGKPHDQTARPKI